MVRRVVPIVRSLLLASGVLLLVSIPFTWFFWAYLFLGPLSVYAEHSEIAVWWKWSPPAALPYSDPGHFGVRRALRPLAGPLFPIMPRVAHDPRILTEAYIPLWLLAFLCLAWPVTSFVIARRRRGTRGFEVEPASGHPLPPGEGDTPRAAGERGGG